MLKLNHANLPAVDVVALRDFFVQHFAFTALVERGDAIAVLKGADGFILNILKAKDAASVDYPENFHVGFLVASPAEVRAKHAELLAAGVNADDIKDLTRNQFSSVTFYCHAPGGILVEVSSPAA